MPKPDVPKDKSNKPQAVTVPSSPVDPPEPVAAPALSGRPDKVPTEDCPRCGATGVFNGNPCQVCYGSGWIVATGVTHTPAVAS